MGSDAETQRIKDQLERIRQQDLERQREQQRQREAEKAARKGR